MICINREDLHKAGETVERVIIQADETPETMPTSGVDVNGLPDAVSIAPASILYVLSNCKKYIMGESGTWQEWTA